MKSSASEKSLASGLISRHSDNIRDLFDEICNEAYAELQDEISNSELQIAAEPIEFYNPRYRENALLKLSWQFASDIIDFVDVLEEMRKYGLSRQLIKCGPSVGANSREAQNAESLSDFIHKLKIALKEADESEFFLSLCQAKEYSGSEKLRKQAYQLVRLLNSIIAKSKLRQKEQRNKKSG